MEQLTTYIVKARNSSNIWQFKYHLNGAFAEFKILEGVMSDVQMRWLANVFPFFEDWIKQWQELLKDNFEISVGDPDLSFEALWTLYDDKRAKQDAIKCFAKLKKGDVIKLFQSIPHYKAYLLTSKVAQAHLATYINKRRFDDEYEVAVSNKTENPLIRALAKIKTEK